MKRFVLGMVPLLGLGAATLSVAEEPSAKFAARTPSCAFVRSIGNWKPVDDRSAIIYTSPNRRFKVVFNAPCREMRHAIFARIDTRFGSGVCLSTGDVLVFRSGLALGPQPHMFEERCYIISVEGVPSEPAKPVSPPT